MSFSLLPKFLKQKQDSVIVLLVDIGSSSVGAALVRAYYDERAPHILVNMREDVAFHDTLTSQRFLFSMNQSLENVFKKLSKQQVAMAIGAPAHIFCTLSSPWFILKPRKIRVVRKEEFEMNERTLNEFIDEDVNLLKDELKATLPPQDVRIIEKKVLQMKLNGYEVRSTRNKKALQAEILLTVAVSSQKAIQSIEGKITKFFHAKEIHFGAFPVVAFNTIRDMFPVERDFIFLDITGEATDISRVDNDLLIKTVSFPYGKNFFIREISTQLATVHHEATTLFSMFLHGELHDAHHGRVADAVSFAGEKWLARFEDVIANFAQKGMLPKKIFFTTDADIAPMFRELMGKTKPSLLMDGAFDVQYLDQLIVSRFVSFEGGVTRDPFIVVEALLAEKLIRQNI